MMSKPQVFSEYDPTVPDACERVLVSLFAAIGPWRESIYLVGGLTPRYLVKAKPPEVRAHAGTGDVDVVVDQVILATTEAYRTLEDNLKALGFERASNKGVVVNWRWQIRTADGVLVILEFLSDDPDLKGGQLQELKTDGNLSAINIPNASLVFDFYETIQLDADRLDGGGRTTQLIRHADIVSFICLKALAFDHRKERKDAHDLVYCLEHAEGALDAVVARFRDALATKHSEVIQKVLGILELCFCDPKPEEGYLREGCVAVASFEIEGQDEEQRDVRALRQRDVNGLIAEFLAKVRST